MENKIGKFIASRRKEKGLTQQQLGEKLFITDKAISKWERGLSLPDISMLTKLAEVLDVDPTEILQGTKKVNKKDISKILDEEKEKIKKYNNKKNKRIFIPLCILIILLLIIIFKNIYLGYSIKKVELVKDDNHHQVEIGVPKFSFMMKNNEHSYSFKNFRSSNVLENEIKNYLKKQKYLTCNNTLYYYNEENDISIIDYSVVDHHLYSTISYNIRDGDYCYLKKLEEYGQYFILRGRHTMNGISKIDEDITNKIVVVMIDGGDFSSNKYEFEIDLEINQLKGWNKGEVLLEKSTGSYEIKDNQLIYYRDKNSIEGKEKDNIPLVSTFTLKDGYIILNDNYLSKYVDENQIEGGWNKYKN